MTHFDYLTRLVLSGSLCLCIGCNQSQRQTDVSAEVQADGAGGVQLEELEVGELDDVHRLDEIYLAGQPSAEDFAEFEAKGVRTVINLRDPLEFTWDIAGTVEELGMDYVHVPIRGAEQLTPEAFEELLGILDDESRQPTLLFCAVASRVGAVWFAHRVLNDGVSEDVATAEARAVGQSPPALLNKAKEYVELMRDGE
jgi:uncharacterized protein (TIGR01244 family)